MVYMGVDICYNPRFIEIKARYIMDLDIFICGETIDLCVPTLDFIRSNHLYRWWNNPIITRYLHSGAFPNTLEKQLKYYEENMNKDLLLLIADKNGEIIGTASIMNICYLKQEAKLGLIFGAICRKNPLEALEVVARITEHSFTKIGLRKIIAEQHIGLIPWSHRMSLLGYRLEGIEREGFVKGNERADLIRIACHYRDYQEIIVARGGSLWDCQEKMLSRIKKLPKKSFHKKLQDFFSENEKYYSDIFALEG